MTFVVGARFVCTPCGLRGPDPRCGGCSRSCLDLTDPDDRAALARVWPALVEHERGRSMLDPRVALRTRAIRAAALAAVVLSGVAATLGPILDGHARERADVIAALIAGPIVALVMAPLTASLVGLTLFYAAHALRLIAAITGALAPIAARVRIGARDLGVVAWLAGALQRAVLPIVELDLPPTAGALRLEGTLAAPLRVEVARDGLALFPIADASVGPLRVRCDDGREELVHLEAGAIRWPPDAGERTDVDGDARPAWLRAPGRRGVGFVRTFPAGTRVRVTTTGFDDALQVVSLGAPVEAPVAV